MSGDEDFLSNGASGNATHAVTGAMDTMAEGLHGVDSGSGADNTIGGAAGDGLFLLSGSGHKGPDDVAGSEGNEGQQPFRKLAVFTGTGGELFELWIVNFLLTVITLGIYHFWAKVRVRKYLWAHTVVEGEPLEYTGTGKELFMGFLVVIGLVLGYSGIQYGLNRVRPGLGGLANLLLIPIWFFASFRAIRYRLTRTRWRGIRFNLSGSAWEYAKEAMIYYLYVALSAGFATPHLKAALRRFVVSNMWYGNKRFSFDGEAGPLYKTFLSCVGLSVLLVLIGSSCVTLPYTLATNIGMGDQNVVMVILLYAAAFVFLGALSLCWMFYSAALLRWETMHTHFPGLGFRNMMSWKDLLVLKVTNGLIVLFTLGFGLPWVTVRTCRIYTSAMEVQGSLDYVHLAQDTQEAPKYGEGFFEAFGVDIAV